jgi:hypothetical protein
MAKKKELPYTLTGKILTAKLHELARDVIACSEIGEDGEAKLETRAEVLAREVWNAALGIKIEDDEDGVPTMKFTHKPIPWAVGVIFERLEGKIVPRARDMSTRPSLGTRVDEQNKLRMDSLKHDS